MVAKTYQNLIYESRELLQDTALVTPRYSDSTLLNILNRGLQDLSRIRPDIMYDLYANNDLGVVEVVQTGAGAGQVDWTDPWGLEMQYYPTMINYVVGVAEITDDEYTQDGRAALLLQNFRGAALSI
jgi:hypothetical protein